MQDTNAGFLQSNQDLRTPPDYYIKNCPNSNRRSRQKNLLEDWGGELGSHLLCSRGWRLELVWRRSSRGWRLELVRRRSRTGWRLELVWRSREQGMWNPVNNGKTYTKKQVMGSGMWIGRRRT
jgi:hypothetical protein